MILTRARRVVVGGLMVGLVGSLTGCQLLGGGSAGNDGDPRSGKDSQAGAVPGPNEITASRSGVFHGTGTEARFKLDIYRIERYGEYSLLRFAVTNLEDTPRAGADLFATGRLRGTFGAFRLLDPVGRRIYYPLRQGGPDEDAFGSWAGYDIQLQPGVRYRGVVYFPPLPQDRDRITVLSGDTAGEFTGTPVVDGSGKPSVNTSTPPPTPKPGQPAKLPAEAPSGDVWSGSDVLYGITDSSSARSNVSSPGKQTVSLRADVLFAFDSAKLSDEAKAVVQKVAPEIMRRADPSKPVIVEGHTDNKGGDSYNKGLSERRAKAVHKELASALGSSASSFQFEVTGKGETEPVADNAHEDGRARNRRVEIEYATKPRGAASASPVPGSSAAPGSPVIGAPAPFHAKDGPILATRKASVDQVAASPTNLTLKVHPFYRDGAYLVAVFEVAAEDTFIDDLDTPGLIGAGFGALTVVDPATQSRYYQVRIGESDDSIYYVGSALGLDGGDSGRHFAYYPAPPAGVKNVTLDAGPFGTIKNVPIR